MIYSVSLHPDVVKYLVSISHIERKRCYESLKKLKDDPFTKRPGCDIKRMIGKVEHFRLRVGDHRFLYIIENGTVLVEEAFRRGKGY